MIDYLDLARRRLAELRHWGAPAGETCPRTDAECEKSEISEISPAWWAEAQEIVAERWTADPRPDLEADSALWSRLLHLAYQRHGDGSGSVFWLLQGLRCCGAALVAHAGHLRLEPRPDAERSGPFVNDLGSEEWATVRAKWLQPHRAAIVALLEALGHPAEGA